jgi:hypothetical protein
MQYKYIRHVNAANTNVQHNNSAVQIKAATNENSEAHTGSAARISATAHTNSAAHIKAAAYENAQHIQMQQ